MSREEKKKPTHTKDRLQQQLCSSPQGGPSSEKLFQGSELTQAITSTSKGAGPAIPAAQQPRAGRAETRPQLPRAPELSHGSGRHCSTFLGSGTWMSWMALAASGTLRDLLMGSMCWEPWGLAGTDHEPRRVPAPKTSARLREAVPASLNRRTKPFLGGVTHRKVPTGCLTQQHGKGQSGWHF